MTNKPEPLNLKINFKPKLTFKWGDEEGFLNFSRGYKKGFERAQEVLKKELKQRIKSACEFYLRYRYDPLRLGKEHPEYKEKLKEHGYKIIDRYSAIMDSRFNQGRYNEWLFKLAFKDVIKEGD